MSILESEGREAKEGSGRFSALKGLQGSARGFNPLQFSMESFFC
jgi:hypothetical protein